MPLQIPWDAVEAIGTWIGSIGTAGALLTAFSIMRNDRRRAERSQAEQISITTVVSMPVKERNNCVVRVQVWNYSPLPIHGLELENNHLQTQASVRYELGDYRGDDPNTLQPGEQVAMSVVPLSLEEAGHRGWCVSFADNSGTAWQYYIQSRRGLTKTRVTRNSHELTDSKPSRD